MRMSLRDGDVIGRIGGDEFAALLPGADDVAAAGLAERLRSAMHGVVVPRGQARISVGYAAGPAGADAAALWAAADQALLLAKRGGRDRYRGAGEVAGSGGSAVRRDWEGRLRRMLEPGGMRTVYQPVVDLHDYSRVGFEGLPRSSGRDDRHEADDLVAAAALLGAARDLDWASRRSAFAGARDLPPGGLLFVNVGAEALLDAVHGADQMALLASWGDRRPCEVVLEITDRAAVHDHGRLRDVVAEYRAEGFRFALDDVGDGHSTFEVLSAAGPEFVKVSRRLTSCAGEREAGAVMAALVAYAAISGAEVVAEGIESDEQAARLRAMGITLGQGSALGRPRAARHWALTAVA
jgi:EAL domain-containing protein (putative c-di-GMP-specific phosphodiesterase class I)